MIVGLSGGICSGKSLATTVLRGAGWRVIDCDEISRYLTDYDPDVRRELRKQFGRSIFNQRGVILRAELASRVFAETAERQLLEQILHPRILLVMRSNMTASRSLQEPLFVVVPLLFELGLEMEFDETWLIACSRQRQLERLQARSGLVSEEAQRWIDAQWPTERKLGLATRILNNDDTISEFSGRVLQAVEGSF